MCYRIVPGRNMTRVDIVGQGWVLFRKGVVTINKAYKFILEQFHHL